MNTIQVCDAIMGSCKTTSIINYMNDHPDDKFLYVTPYLDEANRIKNNCPDLHFATPNPKSPDIEIHNKTFHCVSLMQKGRNVAITHQLLQNFTPAMLEAAEHHKYTLIIDESLDVLSFDKESVDDMKILEDSGRITITDGFAVPNFEDGYNGKFRSIQNNAKNRRLVSSDDGSHRYFCWHCDTNLFEAFDQVIILTYMFDASLMRCYFDLERIPYDVIGVTKYEDCFMLGAYQDYIPEYTASLSNMIHYIGSPNMYDIGKPKYALSKSWFENRATNADIELLKRHILGVYKRYNRFYEKGVTPNRHYYIMWGSFGSKDSQSKKILKMRNLGGNGLKQQRVSWNARATNVYRHRRTLIYPVNVFQNGDIVSYLGSQNIEYSNDDFAVSTLVQWIWRSAIRDGKEIDIYLPALRMKTLFDAWVYGAQEAYHRRYGH